MAEQPRQQPEQPEGQDSGNRPIPALGGMTRNQVISILREQEESQRMKPEILKQLYDNDNKTLITETPPSMIMTKIRMRMVLAITDPRRTKPLIEVFLDAYNEEMISLRRQGRQELLGALQLLSQSEGDGGGTTLGR